MNIYNNEDILRQEIFAQYIEGSSAIKIAKELNINNYRVYKTLEDNNIERRSNSINSKKYTFNENYFEVINDPIKAYWLGFLYADGYISKNKERYNSGLVGLSIHEKDEEHLLKFKNDIQSTHEIKHYKVSKGKGYSETPYVRLILNSKTIYGDLVNHGLVEHKSQVKEPPKNLPKEYEKYFILGYFDGNGSISMSKDKNSGFDFKFRITSTKLMLSFIMEHLYNNETIYKISNTYKRHSYDIVESLDYGGNQQVYKIMKYLYEDTERFLQRKYDRFLMLKTQINGG